MSLYRTSAPQQVLGIGEIALFKGLSADDTPDFTKLLEAAANDPLDALNLPSSAIRFGMETALANAGIIDTPPLRCDSPFSRGQAGIPTNGLVWMGAKQVMQQRIEEKIKQGFRCIKIKIGGIDFDDELYLLKHLRNRFPADVIELRLDANGAFPAAQALEKLERLAQFHIHSIEQPIQSGQPLELARICQQSPIPVALDEELIDLTPDDVKVQMLRFIRPAYIILKPSLCGGFCEADKWIDAAQGNGVRWWCTSALESNIGLEAIARWVAHKDTNMPQGLGTGQLYTNNFPTALRMQGQHLWYTPAGAPSTIVPEP